MAACVQINLFFNMNEEDFLSGVEYVLRWYATASLKKSHNSKKKKNYHYENYKEGRKEKLHSQLNLHEKYINSRVNYDEICSA